MKNLRLYLSLSKSRRNMHTINVTVMSFRENHAIKRSIKRDSNSHHILFTLDLQILDHGHVRGLGLCPRIRETWNKGKNIYNGYDG